MMSSIQRSKQGMYSLPEYGNLSSGRIEILCLLIIPKCNYYPPPPRATENFLWEKCLLQFVCLSSIEFRRFPRTDFCNSRKVLFNSGREGGVGDLYFQTINKTSEGMPPPPKSVMWLFRNMWLWRNWYAFLKFSIECFLLKMVCLAIIILTLTW